jgi:hypothetical protein
MATAYLICGRVGAGKTSFSNWTDLFERQRPLAGSRQVTLDNKQQLDDSWEENERLTSAYAVDRAPCRQAQRVWSPRRGVIAKKRTGHRYSILRHNRRPIPK